MGPVTSKVCLFLCQDHLSSVSWYTLGVLHVVLGFLSYIAHSNHSLDWMGRILKESCQSE